VFLCGLQGGVSNVNIVEPAYKDIIQTSDLIRIVETFTRKSDYKDTYSLRVALSLEIEAQSRRVPQLTLLNMATVYPYRQVRL
jgi:hypothetical protein